MPTAFISHASEDVDVAEAVVEYLESSGVTCWVAPRDVRPGADYPTEILEGIEASDVFVLILSEHANGSVFVRREVERAVSKGKHVFPVRVSDVVPARPLELLVSSSHWIDAWPLPVGPHLAPLVESIREVQSIRPQDTPTTQKPFARSMSDRPAVTAEGAHRRYRPGVHPLVWSALGAAAVIVLVAAWNMWPSGSGGAGSVPSGTSRPPSDQSASVPATAGDAPRAASDTALPAPAPANSSSTSPEAGPLCPQSIPADARLPLTCNCPSQVGMSGSVWGTLVYSFDSMLCLAAVHAGAIPATGGRITATAAGERFYLTGSLRNGIRSGDYGAWKNNITFAGVNIPAGPPLCPTLLLHAGMAPLPLTCRCTTEAILEGAVWGTDIYTEDSDVCRAALHAGKVSSAGGIVTVLRDDGRIAYTGSSRNSVNSSGFSTYPSSIRFQ